MPSLTQGPVSAEWLPWCAGANTFPDGEPTQTATVFAVVDQPSLVAPTLNQALNKIRKIKLAGSVQILVTRAARKKRLRTATTWFLYIPCIQ
jgi:hypothetical protein